MKGIFVLTKINRKTDCVPVAIRAFKNRKDAVAAMKKEYQEVENLPTYRDEMIKYIGSDFAYIGHTLYWDIYETSIE